LKKKLRQYMAGAIVIYTPNNLHRDLAPTPGAGYCLLFMAAQSVHQWFQTM
jgi:hypothetical protein